jgi:mono/diheme cytochrome c family protein
MGTYRLVSTWEGVPTDEDLYGTISRGIPGSAMPSWAHLPEADRWALVHVVKAFADEAWDVPGPTDPPGPEQSGTGIVRVPPMPEDTPELRARGRELFRKACASCHGDTARGDGVQKQKDEKGYPTRPRDLTLGVFKGDPSPESVYRRIVAGMPGSPMPQSAWAYPDDAWSLVHFVRGLSSDELRERVEMKRYALVAHRVKELPGHPDSGAWQSAVPVRLHLMPLWWRTDRPEEVEVRAVHDGTEIALLMTWQDLTDDHTAIRPQDFRDAAAVELAPAGDPPFFAMGAVGEHVDIWMWKSERQADLEIAFQDLEAMYPNAGIDSYPNLLRDQVEQPGRHALTMASDPTFITAWGAGNIVSDPTRRAAGESLRAQGFGTLRARPRPDQDVTAMGVWRSNTYAVSFRRALRGEGEGAVALEPGKAFAVAFAVWNGSAGDRDGKKSVTIWQDLWLGK